VRYLFDTGVWLWTVGSLTRLNPKAHDLLRDGTHELYFSAASSWEIAIKAAIGKLTLPESPAIYVPRRLAIQGIQNLPMVSRHALAVHDLPRHHDDPFDRLLIAQAQTENMVVMTADKVFLKYKVDLLWCGR
jgi:PIN domain nuclease of toxin-antitoxin system